ncbi:unnamed protein product [Blepharisma stoltei]|uniref:Uncharacterized protein n=1 Tax=Blepharisma stoltei TaxID=1481888 RepID=A0AAU9JXB4_9CILI|nr:unnamed protein product [Blepharisma stoltei]
MSCIRRLSTIGKRYFSKNWNYNQFVDEVFKNDLFLQVIFPQRDEYAEEISIKNFTDKIIDSAFIRPPKLEHELERIVRTEGIYKSEEFAKLNNDDFIQKILKPSPEAVARFQAYRPPSQDDFLLQKGKEAGVKFITGSSSITSAMQQIYYTISNFKSPDVTGLAKNYDNQNMNYMSAYRKPTTLMLRKVDQNLYAIDGDHGPLPTSNEALTTMGIVLETMFTTEKELFKRVMDPTVEISKEDMEILHSSSRSYRYRQLGNILVRSQIDCESVSETGEYFVFEIKTRACAPIRYDVKNWENYLDYKIETRTGVHSSYEREYFDLCRSILLKYFFQIKMGRMDGAFVAYHNLQELFGYEYMRLEEMEKRLFGGSDFADQILKSCACILQDALQDAIALFPNDPMLKIGFYAMYRSDELFITIERFDEMEQWNDHTKQIEGIEDELDYYEAFHPGKTAYTLGRRFYPHINGILQKEPLFLEPGDKFSIKQIKYTKGTMAYNEYMYFLHSAYKIDTLAHHKDFAGLWKKFNDFHIYRKPLYRESS